MATKKVTLTISDEAFQKAKQLASENGVSLSRFLADHLEMLVGRAHKYEEARRRSVAPMRRGLELGMGADDISWSRDDVHER